MPDLIGSKFIVEVLSTQGRLHSKFKEGSFSYFKDMSNQTFERISSIFFVFFSHTYQKLLYLTYANLNLAEIWYTYWESKDKYQYQF